MVLVVVAMADWVEFAAAEAMDAEAAAVKDDRVIDIVLVALAILVPLVLYHASVAGVLLVAPALISVEV